MPCLLTVMKCPVLRDPPNGQWIPQYHTTTKHAIFLCNVGYKLAGNQYRICLPNGTWNGSMVVCNRKFSIHLVVTIVLLVW